MSDMKRRTKPLAFALCLAAASIISASAMSGLAEAQQNTRPNSSATAGKSDRAARPASDASDVAALRERIEQLEEKVDDMDVIIATLESMLKTGGRPQTAMRPSERSVEGAIPPSALRGTQPDPTLSAQPRSGGFGQTTVTPGPVGTPGVAPPNPYGQQRTSPELRKAQPQPRQPQPQQKKDNGGFNWFGFGNSSSEQVRPAQPDQQVAGYNATNQVVQDYERAYGFMLRQDYANAETAFRNFLGTHGNSSLAGNAYFWLGEAYYEQQRYREAASSYLTGYRQHKNGQRAADSMLKLGLSLGAIGEKGQACATLLAIPGEFPSAPAHIRRRISREQTKLGCS